MSKKSILSWFLLSVVAAKFLFEIFSHAQFYTRKYDHDYLSEIYSNSQYIKGEKATRGIGDDGLYAFASYYYIYGGDPSSVNFEHPSLGKYLTGLSIVIFQNENLIYLFYGLFVLFITYKFALLIFKNKLYASFATFLLGLSPFFTIQYVPTSSDQLSVALLDLPQTLFFLTGVYLFLIAKKRLRLYVFSSICFGIAFSTKFFPSLLLLLPAFFFTLRKDRKTLVQWFFSLIVIPIIYLLSYGAYFFYHPSIVEFARFQKWIIAWRMGNPFVFGNIWRTIFTGSYKNWWDGGWVTDQEWSISFAAVIVLGLLGGIVGTLKKNRFSTLVFTLCIIYLIYLSVNTVGVARYVLPIYPFFAILSVHFFEYLFGIMKRWQKRKILKQ